jgi:hypothetical protein
MRIKQIDPETYFRVRDAWMVESHMREDHVRTLDVMEENLLRDPSTYWYHGPSPKSFFWVSEVVPGKWARFHTANADGREGFDDRKAAMRLIREIMQDFDLFRLETLVPAPMNAHKSLMWHLGFQAEGRLRRRLRYEGDWVDAEVFGILAEELERKIRKRKRKRRAREEIEAPVAEGEKVEG